MRSSSDTHTFAKRDLVLGPPVIAAIVGVVLGFNAILAISWYLLNRRKRRHTQHKRRISAPVDCEKYEHSVAFAISTGAIPSAALLKAKGGPQENGKKSYYELIRSLQQPPRQVVVPPSPSERLSNGSSQSSSDGGRLSKYVLRPQDIKELGGLPSLPKAKGHAPRRSAHLDVPRAGLTRANSLSAETASIYSSASAPMDYHEHIFRTQPFALDPSPASAPAWVSELPRPPAPAIITDMSAVKFNVSVASPTTSRSSSEDSTLVSHGVRHTNTHSGLAPTSITTPSSSMSSLVRSRTNSNPSPVPPQIRWLTKETIASSTYAKRTNSASSLSTIFSQQEATRAHAATAKVVAVPIAPLNVRRRSEDLRVDLVRTTALQSSPSLSSSSPAPLTAVAPTVPARSPNRPAPSVSVEHLNA